MKRKAYLDLLKWKSSKSRKPLLLQGARQVGKTYLVNEFANNEYSEFFYFNFEKKPDLIPLFKGSLDPAEIIQKLSLYIGKKISSKETLIFFDEIQVCPEAIISLKYFCESAPQYHLIAAGSLLGVSVGKSGSFPVGKVNFMTLYPMSFTEFLSAFDDELASEYISFGKLEKIDEVNHNRLNEKFRLYLYLGGMPEVIANYTENKDITECRRVMDDLIISFRADFAKYKDKFPARILTEVFNSVVKQAGSKFV